MIKINIRMSKYLIMKIINKSMYLPPKNIIPCNLDRCICMVNLNLKESYNDIYCYKQCFKRNAKFTQNYKHN